MLNTCELDCRYDTVHHLTGALEGAIGANLWEMDSPEQLQAVLADAEYGANTDVRDRLHDMDRLTMFLATKTMDEGESDPDKLALLDVVVLNDGFTLEDRAEYAALMAPLAATYGAKVLKSFTISKHLRGELSDAVEFNIWQLPDAEVFAKMTADPAYQANLALRDRLHNMEKLTMILASPVGIQAAPAT